MEALGGACRTCLSPKYELLSLQRTVPYLEHTTYKEILNYCTTFPSVSSTIYDDEQVHINFEFPTHICLRCSKALQVTYHFLKMLRQTDATLQEQQVEHILNMKSSGIIDMDCEEPAFEGIDGKSETSLMHDCLEIPTAIYSNDYEIYNNEHISLNFKQGNKEQSHDNNLSIAVANSKIGSSKEIDKNEKESLFINHHQDEFYLKNAAVTSEESNINDSLFKEIRCLSGTESHKVSENLTNQIKTRKIADASNDMYLQANLNSFVENKKENHRNVEDEITCNFIPKNKSNSMSEESDSCLSSSSYENNNVFTKTKDNLTDKTRNGSITPFGCQNCKYTTCYTESLRKHYKTSHKIEATSKMLSTSVDPRESNKYHELTYECPECGWESHKVESVETHMIYQHSVSESANFAIKTNVNCPLCIRKFKDMRGLHVHLECVHNTENKAKPTKALVKCFKCERSFPTKWSLSVHQRTCIDGPKRIDCNLCNKQYDKLRQFEAHLCNKHGIEMIHECEVCGKTFKTSTALALHRKRHTERHFQCDLCPKNYINRTELRVHIERIHKKKSEVICRTCNASFTSTNALRFHENKEHFKKVYKCNYCDYKCSTTMSWLKIHQYVHTGMPYRCKMCPKEYAFRNHMRRHSINKHGIELAENELADMFRQNTGYPSRYDAFGNAIDSLDIPEVNEEDLEGELAEFGLKFDDIVKDLFNQQINCDDFLNVF